MTDLQLSWFRVRWLSVSVQAFSSVSGRGSSGSGPGMPAGEHVALSDSGPSPAWLIAEGQLRLSQSSGLWGNSEQAPGGLEAMLAVSDFL